MEIQKEREAFEAWYRKEYDNTVIDDSEFSEILGEYESNYYWVDELNQSWKAWQAAKEHESNKYGQITVTHERMQELIAIGVKSSLEAQEQKA